MKTEVLGFGFFDREAAIVARELIGVTLVRDLHDGTRIAGRIVETEAYLSYDDPAAHGVRGRTPANLALFLGPGTLYVHGMHRQLCLDVTTAYQKGPSSVLIRALEPMEGLDVMYQNRGSRDRLNLTCGPGKLSQALAITKAFDRQNISDRSCSLRFVAPDTGVPPHAIVATPRIGLTKGVDLLLRFCLAGSPHLSRSAVGTNFNYAQEPRSQ